MAEITAAEIKKLRDLTGAGFTDCKKALVEADGDLDKAIEILRVKGAAKAAKRGEEREATNGLVVAGPGVMVELNCETDFVAKNDDFLALAEQVAGVASAARPADAAALAASTLPSGNTVGDEITNLSAVIGEKLALGRVAVLEGTTTVYLHRRSKDLPPQVGVLVAYEGDEAGARAAAMQIAALKAQYVSRDDVPADVVENERRIAEATAKEEGKPEAALPKIVEGRVNGFFKDTVLLDQPSVHDSKKSVKAQLEEAGTTIRSFARFEVGS